MDSLAIRDLRRVSTHGGYRDNGPPPRDRLGDEFFHRMAFVAEALLREAAVKARGMARPVRIMPTHYAGVWIMPRGPTSMLDGAWKASCWSA
jgi:hypothetical protein